jgi:hypothetical protein
MPVPMAIFAGVESVDVASVVLIRKEKYMIYYSFKEKTINIRSIWNSRY